MFSIKIKIKILSYFYELEHILYSVKTDVTLNQLFQKPCKGEFCSKQTNK